ncbi:MAG: hypothetical protein RMZ41_028360 [Nostoc sp. DedVER02]|uniref:hypothetical protein n=1 Tax=unclassified Nostoc TaxID=2593658 RepID=UPI002AD44902|nr:MULTISPECIES: hypothetical protein [unclassified Nostoc]MDZ7987872.1 hypothetical protein [Nostoc sp. DedVER02]MDZ8115278.1 hypothetical protein [Nostoc sp. DedVER01b]
MIGRLERSLKQRLNNVYIRYGSVSYINGQGSIQGEAAERLILKMDVEEDMIHS